MTPHFLIIGAMKAGTTTLYQDLVTHPDIYMPSEKEPETLLHDTASRAEADYADLFRAAPAGAICGEASTAYTKRPDHNGIAERAKAVCGPTLKLIYLTRDPIKRMVSHYKHDVGFGTVTQDFATAALNDPKYVNYTRYSYQIAPWIAAFGEESLLQIRFEDYVQDRNATVRDVCTFLNIDPEMLPLIDPDKTFNASDGRRTARHPLIRAVIESHLYQRGLKPFFPAAFRHGVQKAVVPVRAMPDVTVTDTLRQELHDRLASDDA